MRSGIQSKLITLEWDSGESSSQERSLGGREVIQSGPGKVGKVRIIEYQ